MLRNLNELFPKAGRTYRYNPETLEVFNWKPSGLLQLKLRSNGQYAVRTSASKRLFISKRQMQKALDALNQEN